MKFTGERYIPDLDVPEISYEHWHRYLYATQFVEDKVILDIACGEGYGSYLLARFAKHVVGVDVSVETINHAASFYLRKNLEFKVGSLDHIPFQGQALFDGVVSFESIEHVGEEKQEAFLREVKRVLKPGGFLLISTPNKLTYSDMPAYQNEFHVREFYPHEFRSFLSTYFKNVRFLGQRIYPVSYLWDVQEDTSEFVEFKINFSPTGFRPSTDEKVPLYIVALCSDGEIRRIPQSIQVDLSGRILTIRDEQIGMFRSQLAEHEIRLQALQAQLAEREQVIEGLRAELSASRERAAALERQLAEREQQNTALTLQKAALQQELDSARAALRAQQQESEQKLQNLNNNLLAIYNSKAWKIIEWMRRVRLWLAPRGSWREKIGRRIFSFFRRRSRPMQSDYDKWIATNEPSPADLKAQRSKINEFDGEPLISVIVPVWNTPVKILNQTIRSVMDQTYSKWELCIADGNSNPETKKVLSYWARKDRRIKIKFLSENKGIAENTNEALSLAKGEFIAFLDHDDLLAPFALFEVVSCISNNTNVDVIYSDEDKVDEIGRRFDPFFKPAFSPDYLRSVNYMAHFLVVRKSLGDQIGWLREGYEGAQDYDLILRLVEKARVIIHIPKVLYHWRVSATSTAGGVEAKSFSSTSGKKALQEHLERIGLTGEVEDGYLPTWYRVHYRITSTPLVSIIIPNHDHAADLERCVNSILEQTTYPNFEIILVENGSKEQETFRLYEQLKENTRIHILKWDRPFNYSSVNNWAAAQANGKVLLFLNNDTQVLNKDWLEQMLQFAMRPDVGAVGAKLYYPDGTIQHGGVVIGLGGGASHSHKYFPKSHPGYFGRLVVPHNVSAVTGACLMIRKQVFQEVNGFDENYQLAFGDVDFCLKVLQKGYLIVWTPYAELYHHESKTRGYEDTEEKQRRFKGEVERLKQKWSDFLQKGDPYYNPNLTLDREDFSIGLSKVEPT